MIKYFFNNVNRVLQCDNGLLWLVSLINSTLHGCFTALHAATGGNPSRAHENAFSKAILGIKTTKEV